MHNYLTKTLGFTQGDADDCYYHHKRYKLRFGLYVDDYEYTGAKKHMDRLEQKLGGRYDKKDLGTISDGNSNFVGVRRTVHKGKQLMMFDQQELGETFLKEWSMMDVKPKYIPADPNAKLPPPTPNPEQKLQTEYRSKAGFLLHIATVSRPDLAQVAWVATQYLHGPTQEHLDFVNGALKYFRTTIDTKLTYHCKRSPTETAFCTVDSAFANLAKYLSQYGWAIFLCGAAWSWRVSKGTIQAHSSCEAEYQALSDLVREVQFARKMFDDFDIEFPHNITILEDNMGAIALCTGPSPHHQRTKHIGVKYHFVRDLVKSCVVRIQHQDTQYQPADLFTKSLPRPAHERHAAVIMGHANLVVKALPLPTSTRKYLELHNQQLKKTTEELSKRSKRT